MGRVLNDISSAKNLIAAAGKIRVFDTTHIGFGKGK